MIREQSCHCYIASINIETAMKQRLQLVKIDPFHTVISLSNRSSIEKSIKPFLKMKGQIAHIVTLTEHIMMLYKSIFWPFAARMRYFILEIR